MFEFFSPDTMNLVYTTPQLAVGTLSKTEGTTKKSKQEALCVYAGSIKDYMDFLDEHCPYAAKGKQSDEYEAGQNVFTTYKETFDTFRYQPHKVVAFDSSFRNIEVPHTSGNEVEYDVWGDFLDMDRYLEGVPEVFGRHIMGNPTSTFVNIYMVWNVQYGVEAETINHRAARVMRLIDWLENHNVRVMLRLIRGNATMVSEIQVKDHDEALEISTIAVAGHSDFFRRMCWRAAEWSKTWSYGYGQAHTLKEYLPLVHDLSNITILLDSFTNVDVIDKKFDKLEEDLEQMLSDGITYGTLEVHR